MLAIEMTKKSSDEKGKRKRATAQKEEVKRGKGRPQLYDDPKVRHEVGVTAEGWAGIVRLAKEAGVSTSEFIERIGRGTIALAELPSVENDQTEK